MATRAALGAIRDKSVKQIAYAADRLAGVAGIEPVVIPAHSRDLEHLQAYQLEALAGWLTNLADAVAPVEEAAAPVEVLAGDELPTEDAAPKSKSKKK